jgi:hypothetical protein
VLEVPAPVDPSIPSNTMTIFPPATTGCSKVKVKSTNILRLAGTFLLLVYEPYFPELEKSHLADETVPDVKSSENENVLLSYVNLGPPSYLYLEVQAPNDKLDFEYLAAGFFTPST